MKYYELITPTLILRSPELLGVNRNNKGLYSQKSKHNLPISTLANQNTLEKNTFGISMKHMGQWNGCLYKATFFFFF